MGNLQNRRVLICINNLGVGGAEKLVIDDINEMLKRGLPICLLTLKREPVSSLAEKCLISKEYWHTVHFKGFFDIVGWLKIVVFLKKEKPDIIFTHLWFTNTIIRIVGRLLRLKNIITFEHNVYDTIKTKKMYLADKLLQNWCYKIVAVSSAVRQSLIASGINSDRIVVINNGIDISKYRLESDFSLKRNLQISENVFVFLTIARLIHQKGIDILLTAFAKLSENTVLLIVGQGEDKNKLKKQVENLGLSSRVHFLGVRDDVPALLSVCDCFVLASRYEGLGIVVLEAMAATKPIIISNFEASRDMIINGQNGLVVGKENPEELAKAMKKIMSDVFLRKKLAQAAYEKVQRFSVQNHVNKMLCLFQ